MSDITREKLMWWIEDNAEGECELFKALEQTIHALVELSRDCAEWNENRFVILDGLDDDPPHPCLEWAKVVLPGEEAPKGIYSSSNLSSLGPSQSESM